MLVPRRADLDILIESTPVIMRRIAAFAHAQPAFIEPRVLPFSARITLAMAVSALTTAAGRTAVFQISDS